ncbi:hypothetical protein IFM89_003105 [Coptis chinensis]|uniref:Transmembrane protein n=1 Tax=Coptis chinensis TaxID=261450 RepID=A0A835IU72_9MAGN|nr:hypothetical protein IFM89_003105 [Coptis chinensis]
MATENLSSFCSILKESRKLISSHSRHFLALSVLFLLPLSFSLIAFPTLQSTITNPVTTKPQTLLRYNLHTLQRFPAFFSLLYTFILILFTLSASASITFSVYHAFYARPVKLVSALASLSNSFFRLFATFFCGQVMVFAALIVLGLVCFGVVRGFEYLGYEIADFKVGYVIGVGLLGFVFFCLQVNWVLAPVIVVVESSWGLEPLRRSAYLVKEMRWVVVCMLLYFGGIGWLFVWGSWQSSVGEGVLRGVMFVVQTVLVSAALTMMMLHCVAANTVLYMYCKALHGELAGEIAEEFAREYVTLPFDDEKVPHLVSFVHP